MTVELIVEGPGLFVGKHQGRLRVSRDKATLNEAPLLHLRQVVLVGGGIGISSDAVRACSEEGIPIHFLSSSGTALAGPGRETRGAVDPLNSALNYGYGVLYAQVEQALILAGLDPYAGFLHADRPGKPSLVLDLIEEVRQTVVDRTVIGLVNRGM